MLRWRTRFVVSGALAVVAVGALALVPNRNLRPLPAAAPVLAATSRPAARSCKVAPDVTVTLSPGAMLGAWHVHLEALVAASEVVVTIGTGNAGAELQRQLAWRGGLAAGERRDLELRLEVANGATAVWAEAAVGGQVGTIQRGRATLSVLDGKPVAQVADEPAAGRLVQDPQSGIAVVEFPGTAGGGR